MSSTKVAVTITYRHDEARPPVFAAGTFTDPPWSVQEMDHCTDELGRYTFTTRISADPGSEVQYKIRLGQGDWWVLNGEEPTVTDGHGNQNNLLKVPASRHQDLTSNTENGLEVQEVVPLQESTKPQPVYVANAAKALLGQSVSRSGANTPGIAQTAADVADSAALLDHEPQSDHDISDSEAGRIGYRRMSCTPISQVADTAAEVADSARVLDLDDACRENDVQSTYRPSVFNGIGDSICRNQNLDKEHVDSESKTPLFAHECAGMQNEPLLEVDGAGLYDLQHGIGIIGAGTISNPSPEAFPASRHKIMDTVHSLESGFGEDGIDSDGHALLSPPKSPRGSKAGRPLSISSLDSIFECEEPALTAESHPAAVHVCPTRILTSTSFPAYFQPAPIAPDSYDDDSRKYGPEVIQDGAYSISGPKLVPTIAHRAAVIDSVAQRPKNIHRHATEDGVDKILSRLVDGTVARTGAESGTAASRSNASMKKRSGPVEQPSSPRAASIHSIVAADKNSNWVAGFIRVLFVDWIGGFFQKLFGRRRKTLLATGTVAAVLALWMWKSEGNGSFMSMGG